MSRWRTAVAVAGGGLLLAAPALLHTAGAQADPPATVRERVGQALGNPDRFSAGLRMWLAGPPRLQDTRAQRTPVFGSNVDANDPNRDLAAGQGETAIAAQRSGRRRLVLAGWNDVSGLLASPVTPAGSATGVGLSADGGASFRDLVGLPNRNVDQMWSGDPVVASLQDGRHFAVASLYYPSGRACLDDRPANGTIAVTVGTVNSAGTGATFGAPMVVSRPGNLCTAFTPGQPKNLATLDKDWLAYDPVSRTLAVSYTRFYFPAPPVCDPSGCTLPPGAHSGNGQIEIVRATVPTDPAAMSARAFSKPVIVWPEEPACAPDTQPSLPARCDVVNQGAYVAVAAGGDADVAWERNVNSNLFNGDPWV